VYLKRSEYLYLERCRILDVPGEVRKLVFGEVHNTWCTWRSAEYMVYLERSKYSKEALKLGVLEKVRILITGEVLKLVVTKVFLVSEKLLIGLLGNGCSPSNKVIWYKFVSSSLFSLLVHCFTLSLNS